ncbi:MAG: sulfur carrier protein ThiS [Phycisphaerales bacterium]
MTLTVNGEKIDVPGDRLTVQALVAERGFAGGACAVEVNRALVPHRERDSRELRDGDVVEIVTLVGGG